MSTRENIRLIARAALVFREEANSSRFHGRSYTVCVSASVVASSDHIILITNYQISEI